ncbi:MAG: hypothetical protein SFZ03_01930 [Candidatus Melainabacteria bacterium]|nr:hypothetical protein [Candidatus Melainabacteria bacterium]
MLESASSSQAVSAGGSFQTLAGERLPSGHFTRTNSYGQRVLRTLIGAQWSWPERVLLVALLAALTISGLDAFHGRQVGDPNTIRMAKAQAQQELVAGTATPTPNGFNPATTAGR